MSELPKRGLKPESRHGAEVMNNKHIQSIFTGVALLLATTPTALAGQFDACDVTSGTPGCIDPGVETCVCAADMYCCTDEWDAICVFEVGSLQCDQETCLEAKATPGCLDADVSR